MPLTFFIVSNVILAVNVRYNMQSDKINQQGLEDAKELLDEENSSSDAAENKNSNDANSSNKSSSITDFINNLKDKTSDTVDAVGTAASEKISAFEKGLNKILEGVAVMIVTTCAIPVLVMLTFVWILKSITGLKLPNITQQSIPKVSEMKRKKKSEIDG